MQHFTCTSALEIRNGKFGDVLGDNFPIGCYDARGGNSTLAYDSGLDSTVGWRCRIDVINAWYSGSDELFSDA